MMVERRRKFLPNEEIPANSLSVDLVMWTKNGAPMLPLVLQRINEVIPKKNVKKRILADDHSTDGTTRVAESFGWTVYNNKGFGIADNIATALSHVTSDFFISIEQDVILSRSWWRRMSNYMKDERVAVAQGVRVATHPVLRKIDEYMLSQMDVFSLDNNIYRTNVIFDLLDEDVLAAETRVRKKVESAGMKWILDKTIVSEHIRNSVLSYIQHAYRMKRLYEGKPARLDMFKFFLWSPFRAFQIALAKNCPHAIIVYPLNRLEVLRAELEIGGKYHSTD
jgi:glycosyltransferase involved in cell wall biosynthesis